jgi:hypothetical protein
MGAMAAMNAVCTFTLHCSVMNATNAVYTYNTYGSIHKYVELTCCL